MLTINKINTLDTNEFNNLANLWNESYGFIYPITQELLIRNTNKLTGFRNDLSYYAKLDNEVVGFILNKVWDRLDGLYPNTAWISLIFVSPKYRLKGIGTALLKESLQAFEHLKIKDVYLGKDYQNFFPGLPKDLKESLQWFINRGFNVLGETNDLINLNIDKFIPTTFKTNNNYNIRLANNEDFPNLIAFMKANFPGRWVVELEDYINNHGIGKEFIICTTKENIICGFCRIGNYQTPIDLIGYSLTWRNRFVRLGGIGPLGVDSKFRKQNIASNLIAYAIELLKDAKCDNLVIDWTNLLQFYRKFGFEIWKTYIYLKK